MTQKTLAVAAVGAGAGALVLGVQQEKATVPMYDTWSPEARATGQMLLGLGAFGLLYLMAGGR